MVRLLARQRSRTLELIGLHALAVPDKSAVHGENLVRVMTTGRKAPRRSHLEGGLVGQQRAGRMQQRASRILTAGLGASMNSSARIRCQPGGTPGGEAARA